MELTKIGPVRPIPAHCEKFLTGGGVTLALATAKKNPDSGDSISDCGEIEMPLPSGKGGILQPRLWDGINPTSWES